MRRLIIFLALAFGAGSASGQWVPAGAFGDTAVLCFAVSGTNLFAGVYGRGVLLSTNNGTNWTATGLDTGDVESLVTSGSNLFAACGGVFRSTNNGTSWTAVNNGLTNPYVWAFAVSGTNLFAGTYGGGVFLSTNNAEGWVAVNNGLTHTDVRALAVSGTNLFAGTIGGGVFLSTNNGTSWDSVNAGLTSRNVHALAVSGTNLFADTHVLSGNHLPYSRLFLSTNNGTSWIEVAWGWGGTINALIVSGTNLFAGQIYAIGQEGGVFLSTNNGTSWTAVDDGFTNPSVSALAVSGPYLFAGTNWGRVWRRPLSEMITSVDDRKALPVEFALAQNYPNPFNPSTTITYDLPKSSVVRLIVSDILGREVSILVNERRDAGVHEVNFDGSGLSSGVYLYRLEAGDFVQAKKLLLMK